MKARLTTESEYEIDQVTKSYQRNDRNIAEEITMITFTIGNDDDMDTIYNQVKAELTDDFTKITITNEDGESHDIAVAGVRSLTQRETNDGRYLTLATI